jgi:hypothetical protein
MSKFQREDGFVEKRDVSGECVEYLVSHRQMPAHLLPHAH